MGKLMKSVGFVEGEWQRADVQQVIAEHNAKVQVAWLASGGDPKRKFWWHVTEITLDHLRPSPEWQKENEQLELAKECEALMRRGLKEAAKRRQEYEEKMRLLREVAELFKTHWPQPKQLGHKPG
jgi:hypothetical protein